MLAICNSLSELSSDTLFHSHDFSHFHVAKYFHDSTKIVIITIVISIFVVIIIVIITMYYYYHHDYLNKCFEDNIRLFSSLSTNLSYH